MRSASYPGWRPMGLSHRRCRSTSPCGIHAARPSIPVIQARESTLQSAMPCNRPQSSTLKSMAEIHPRVMGIDLDPQTRCTHCHSTVKTIAIKMKCCGVYYACKDCHDGLADHAIEVWPGCEWDQAAVLCRACGAELSIPQYLNCFDKCPGVRRRSTLAEVTTILSTSREKELLI
jgi:uncharacterized CHY-type Zn-finger protein